MSTHKDNRFQKARSVEGEKPAVAHRPHALRQRLWGAAGIASCAEYAAASSLAPDRGKPDLGSAMAVLHDCLNDAAGDLEAIIDELGGPPED